MPSTSEVIDGIERRLSSRRAETTERRNSGRKDPAPRRSQLRRKTDVVEYLGAPRQKSSLSDPTHIGLLPKRPLKSWIEKGLNRDTRSPFS